MMDLGVGTDVWAVPFDNITTIFHLGYVLIPLYTVGGAFVRSSIALFYVRIFGPKRILVAVLLLNVSIQFAWLIAVSFLCTPLSQFWTQWWNDSSNSCHNIASFIVSTCCCFGTPSSLITNISSGVVLGRASHATL